MEFILKILKNAFEVVSGLGVLLCAPLFPAIFLGMMFFKAVKGRESSQSQLEG